MRHSSAFIVKATTTAAAALDINRPSGSGNLSGNSLDKLLSKAAVSGFTGGGAPALESRGRVLSSISYKIHERPNSGLRRKTLFGFTRMHAELMDKKNCKWPSGIAHSGAAPSVILRSEVTKDPPGEATIRGILRLRSE